MHAPAQFVCRLTLVLGFVCVTLYPFSFLSNHAILTTQAAIFEKPGILVWRGHEISPEIRRMVIRLIARPYSTNQKGPARILTISRDHYHSNLTIGQEGPDLIIRLRRDTSSALGVPPFVVPRVFDSLIQQSLEVAIDRNTLTVRVNGKRALSQKLADNPFSFWDAKYSLALGNEHTWQRPWIGEIYVAQLTIDAATFDLLDSVSISSAGIFHRLRHNLVLVSTSVVDLILNFAVMLPIGALTALTFCRHRIVWTVGLWFIVSAIVETTQALSPVRIPAISDLVLNVAGAGVGGWFLVRFSRVLRR